MIGYNFRNAIEEFISSWPSDSNLDDIDAFGSKWKEIAEENRDPYILFMIIFFRTFRRQFSYLYQNAMIGDESFVLVDYLKKMIVIKEAVIDYSDALLINDLERQYINSTTLASLAQAILGVKNEERIIKENSGYLN